MAQHMDRQMMQIMDETSMDETAVVVMQPEVFVANAQVMANSTAVAAYFEKRHDHVLRTIDEIIGDLPKPGEVFHETSYVARNNATYRSYNMTRDGFMLLVMTFSGERAFKHKLRWIEEFNRMEAELRKAAVAVVPQKKLPSGVALMAIDRALERMLGRWELSQSSEQALAKSLYSSVGIDLPDPVVTVSAPHTTSAIAKSLGVNASTLGKMATSAKLKDSPANGQRRLTTAPNGKQVEQFCWTDAGRDRLIDIYNAKLSLAEMIAGITSDTETD